MLAGYILWNLRTSALVRKLGSHMFELKPLSPDAIPQALEKAHHYRLLNEPAEAESICLDVLEIDPDNQQALVTLLLALTDRLTKGYAIGARKRKDVCRGSRTITSAPITLG